MAHVRDLHDVEAVAVQELREGDLVVPTGVTLVDARSTAHAVDEVRGREHVWCSEGDQTAGLQVFAGHIEEGAGVRQMLDQLTGPDDVEGTAEAHGLRVGGNDRNPTRACPPGERLIELDAYDLGRDRRDERVHPVGPVHPRTGADIEHRATLEEVPDPRKTIGMRSRLPVLWLQRMMRSHGPERTTRPSRLVPMVAALTLAVALVAGCSASNDSAASNPPSTPSSGGASPTSTAKGAAGVVTIDGTDDRTVNLPSGLKLPLIVHAHYAGPGSFVVRSVDDTGSALQVLATGFAYDGTFAVGFLDPRRQPTVGLRVSATGAWHLDIARA